MFVIVHLKSTCQCLISHGTDNTPRRIMIIVLISIWKQETINVCHYYDFVRYYCSLISWDHMFHRIVHSIMLYVFHSAIEHAICLGLKHKKQAGSRRIPNKSRKVNLPP